MTILLIIYLVSFVGMFIVTALTAYKESYFTLGNLITCILVTLAPVLNTLMILRMAYDSLNQLPLWQINLKGKKNETNTRTT